MWIEEKRNRYTEKEKWLSINHFSHIYLSPLFSDSANHVFIFDIILEQLEFEGIVCCVGSNPCGLST